MAIMKMEFDPAVLAKLGLTQADAEELLAQGVTLSEYAAMIGEDIRSEADQSVTQPIQYKVVHAAQIFQNAATGNTTATLSGVPLHFNTVRGLFPNNDSISKDPPLCSSVDGQTGRYTTEDGAFAVRACASCPYNQYPAEGGGKPCKEQRRIYLLEEGHDVPAVVTVPPTSLKVWDAFVSGCAYAGTAAAQNVIELSLEKKEKGKNTWSVLKPVAILRKLRPVEYVGQKELRERCAIASQRTAVTREEYMGAE